MILYKYLYKETENWRPSFRVECPRITIEENKWLQRHFSKEDEEEVIKSCEGEKAPTQMVSTWLSRNIAGR